MFHVVYIANFAEKGSFQNTNSLNKSDSDKKVGSNCKPFTILGSSKKNCYNVYCTCDNVIFYLCTCNIHSERYMYMYVYVLSKSTIIYMCI